MTALRFSFVVTVLLALVVVTVGSYVRLTDAGLGCPDWPGCYGQLVGVPDTDHTGEDVNKFKAWIEVSHRYIAATLGLLIVGNAIAAWVLNSSRREKILTIILSLLVMFQGILGALTVTSLLKPVIVTGHLLGGMGVLALCATLAFKSLPKTMQISVILSSLTKFLAIITFCVLVAQVTLGGWVSTNYAGLACGTSFPSCSDSYSPTWDSSAFALDRKLAKDINGKPITQQALASVQWAHRIGAFILTLFIITVIFSLWRLRQKALAISIFTILLTQILIGIYIVIHALPLYASMLHNLAAAMLVAWFAALFVFCQPNLENK